MADNQNQHSDTESPTVPHGGTRQEHHTAVLHPATELSRTAGRFRIEEELGHGGIGVVWKAHDPELRRSVAIKVLRSRRAESESRFVREAQITSQLQHPFIPVVYDMGRLRDGSPFLAMKLIEGQTLSKLLRARPSPQHDLPRFLAIFGQVCQAVAFAHTRGVLHRDLKPSNIMVGAFGEVQVMDWGLAKVLGGDPEPAQAERPCAATPDRGDCHTPLASGDTRASEVLGTPGYTPPEQARGEAHSLDERADVFGLGAILCEILTGLPPFTGPDSSTILLQAAEGDLSNAFALLDRCEVDACLVKLTKACLNARREERPRSGEEVARTMEAYHAGVQERLRVAELERTRAEVKSAEQRKRHRLRLALATAVALLLAVGGAAAWWSERQQAEIQRQKSEQEAKIQLRRDRLSARLKAVLAEMDTFKERGLWKEARASLQDVQSLAEQDGTEAQRQAIAEALLRLEHLRRLDKVRQDSSLVVDGRLNSATTPRRYAETFRFIGLDVLGADPAKLAQQVRESPIREAVVDALDDWACSEPKEDRRARLWQITAAVTGERWREHLADGEVWKSAAALKLLLTPEVLRALRPPTQEGLGLHLEGLGGDGLAILEEGCRRHPADFWLLFGTANVFRERRQQPDAAIGYYRAALVVQPKNAAVYLNLGVALYHKKDLDGSITATRRAIDLDPQIALAWSNLGNALREKNDIEGAIAACRRALALDPTDPKPHTNLGLALRDKKDMVGAEAACRKAIEIDPKFVLGYVNLAAVVIQKGDWKEGTAIVEKGIAIAPRDGALQSLLAIVRLMQGRFVESKAAGRLALELLPPNHAMRENLPLIIGEAEMMLGVEKRLPDILSGKEKARDATELLRLAKLCHQYRSQHAAAVRLYSEAFAMTPSTADDLDQHHRFNAAVSAILAAAGQGTDAATLKEQERVDLRQQALAWLRADLAAWNKHANQKTAWERLRSWQTKPDLASVRDASALSKLPQEEREAWQKLWSDVAQVLKR
jgi:tetratricopeptide (TPR) repeat protein/tRNA A-37 threonylcarbamoyl transferase component Bud32